ncbi:MAG: RNA-binding protein [Cellulosilyticaceae bacterium]
MNINWNSIANPEEKLFLKTLVEYRNKADKQYRCQYTDFYYTEWMQEVIQKYVGSYQLNPYIFAGGYEDAERKIVALLPETDAFIEIPISILKLTVKTGIGKPLVHRDFLGALLGLGIERSKVGDIIVKDFGAYIMVHQDIEEFVMWNLSGISRYGKIEIEVIDEKDLAFEKPNTKEIQCGVASLRADVILAAAFGLSRGETTKLFENDRARCNGMIINANKSLKEGDICTLRGHGKIKFTGINGKTKKNRLHITIEKYI